MEHSGWNLRRVYEFSVGPQYLVTTESAMSLRQCDANLISQGKTMAGTSQVPGGWLGRRLKAVSITGRPVPNLYTQYC